MNEIIKFSISFCLFSIIFSTVMYFKISKTVGLVIFAILFLITILNFISKKFASNFKAALENMAKFIGSKLAIVALFLVYIFAIIPTKIVAILAKRDKLRLKSENKESYWLEIKEEKQNWDLQY